MSACLVQTVSGLPRNVSGIALPAFGATGNPGRNRLTD